MAKSLTEQEQEMWDKLKYVPPAININNFDVNSMYPSFADQVIGVQPMEAPAGATFTIRVLKNR